MTRYAMDAIKIEDDGDIAVLFRTVGSFNHARGVQTSGPNTGNLHQEEVYVTSRAEEFAFDSTALETLLDTISLLTGKCVVDGASEVGFEAYGQALDACAAGGRASGSNHLKILCEHSHLLINSISASVGQDATASVRAICLSDDGANEPTSTVYNVALPSSPITDEVFTLAAPRIAGTTLSASSVQSVNLETNLELKIVPSAGSIFAVEVLPLKSKPVIRIVTDDINTIEALVPRAGVSCTNANSFLAFQKRDNSGGLVAAASSAHVKITYEGYAYINEAFNAGGANPGTLEVMIECLEPTSGVPLTVTTGVAI